MSFYTLKRETCIYNCLIAIWGKGMNIFPGLMLGFLVFHRYFRVAFCLFFRPGVLLLLIVSRLYRHEITKTRTKMARDIIYLVKQLVGRSYDRTTKPCLQNIELRVQNPHNTNSIPVKTLE